MAANGWIGWREAAMGGSTVAAGWEHRAMSVPQDQGLQGPKAEWQQHRAWASGGTRSTWPHQAGLHRPCIQFLVSPPEPHASEGSRTQRSRQSSLLNATCRSWGMTGSSMLWSLASSALLPATLVKPHVHHRLKCVGLPHSSMGHVSPMQWSQGPGHVQWPNTGDSGQTLLGGVCICYRL